MNKITEWSKKNWKMLLIAVIVLIVLYYFLSKKKITVTGQIAVNAPGVSNKINISSVDWDNKKVTATICSDSICTTKGPWDLSTKYSLPTQNGFIHSIIGTGDNLLWFTIDKDSGNGTAGDNLKTTIVDFNKNVVHENPILV